MVFSAPIFLFFFLPVVLGIYWVMPKWSRNSFLFLASLFFYAWGETIYVLLMLGSIAGNYLLGLGIERVRGRSPLQRAMVLGIGIGANLAILGFYKYANFAVAQLNALFPEVGFEPISWEPVHLPIGISFFTFQALSYLVDIHRGEVAAQHNPARVGLYIALFPQLIAGPIVRYGHIARQLVERHVDLESFASGVQRFILGLGKKVIVANLMAQPADIIFGLDPTQRTMAVAWFGVLCYGLQIYFDFSGYSDMAIGLGRMFGFRFPENFRHPYAAASLTDFWRRWHISLSTWFRDYLYIPLGGNRGSHARTLFNLWLVFFLCGLWHGASWNFILWGCWHGGWLMLERWGRGWHGWTLWKPLRHGITLVVVGVSWIFFRAESLGAAWEYLGNGLGHGVVGPTLYSVGIFVTGEWLAAFGVALIACLPWREWAREGKWIARFAARLSPLGGQGAAVAFAAGTLLWSMMRIADGTYDPFIYFRF